MHLNMLPYCLSLHKVSCQYYCVILRHHLGFDNCPNNVLYSRRILFRRILWLLWPWHFWRLQVNYFVVSLTLGFSDVSSWWDSNLVSEGISQKRDYILLTACYQVADDFELLSLSIKKTFLKNQIILAVHGTKFVIYPGESGYKNTLWSKSFSGERPLPWYQLPFLEWKLSSGGGSGMWLTPNIC